MWTIVSDSVEVRLLVYWKRCKFMRINLPYSLLLLTVFNKLKTHVLINHDNIYLKLAPYMLQVTYTLARIITNWFVTSLMVMIAETKAKANGETTALRHCTIALEWYWKMDKSMEDENNNLFNVQCSLSMACLRTFIFNWLNSQTPKLLLLLLLHMQFKRYHQLRLVRIVQHANV